MILHKDKKFRWIINWFSNYDRKQFSLGFSFASEPVLYLPVGVDYSILNTSEKIEYINKREYYIYFNLGFWQLTFGFCL